MVYINNKYNSKNIENIFSKPLINYKNKCMSFRDIQGGGQSC